MTEGRTGCDTRTMEGDSFVWDIGPIGLLDKHQQVIENETGYIGLSGKMDKIQYSTKHLGIVNNKNFIKQKNLFCIGINWW